jgi:hypothetical protein
MKQLILNELYSCFKKRNWYVLLLLCLNVLLQAYKLLYTKNVEGVTAINTDGILQVCGGLDKKFFFLNLVQWMLLIGILLLIVQISTSIIAGFDIYLLTRSGSKLRWWIAKVVSLVLINFMYTIMLMIITKIICCVVFKNSNKWSAYSYLYYHNIYASNIDPNKMQLIVFSILITGFIALTTLFQTIKLIFNNYSKSYIVILIICIMLGILYMGGIIPRILSPINYPSTLDIVPDSQSYLKNIAMNIILSLINIVIGIMVVTNSDYRVEKN